MNEAALDDAPRDSTTTIRLRAVGVAVFVTVLACGALAAWALVEDAGAVDRGPFLALVIVAAVASLVLWRLPWRRLLAGRAGLPALYVWTLGDLVLISAALHFSGGGRSELFFLYALPMVFSAVLYPTTGLAGVVAANLGSYAVVAMLDGDPDIPVAGLRLAMLVTLAILAGFLAQLVAAARAEADRRAALLEAVAVGSRSISRLEHAEVLRAVVDALALLGYDARNLAVFDEDGETYTVEHGVGLPDGYGDTALPASMGMPGLVREAGHTVVVDDYAANPRGVPVIRDAGFRSVVGAPIRVGDRMVAVLVGGTRQARTITREEVEAIELLAVHAGIAWRNAEQFEEERRMVERLEELDVLKRDFVANVSHELRTPLTVVKGLGKTLEAKWRVVDDDVRDELLARLTENADVLGATIDNLLDFARIEAGRLDVRPVEFDLADLLGRVAARLGPLFHGRGLRVDVDPDIAVVADPELIDRVCENLLSNAAKHTPEGANVRVLATVIDRQGRVVVQDDGGGIPEHEVARLGDRFFRGGDANTRPTRGTGLGLAFAREVLELHGSRLEVASAVGVGSAFAFSLPLSTAPVPARDELPARD